MSELNRTQPELDADYLVLKGCYLDTSEDFYVPPENATSDNLGQSLTGGGSLVKSVNHRPPHYLMLTLIVSIFNPLLGLPGVVCSFLTMRYTKKCYASKATIYSKAALWLSKIGLVLFLVVLMLILFYVFVIEPNIIRKIDWLTNVGHYKGKDDTTTTVTQTKATNT